MSRYVIVLAGALAGFAVGYGQAAVMAEWGFEQGIGGWQSIDPQAQVTVAAGEAQAAEGAFSLHISYTRPATAADLQQRGPMLGGIVKQIEQPFEGKPTCLEFAVRTNMLTTLVSVANESDGSTYTRPVTVLPGQWQRVALYLDEFSLSDDSQDENSQLDGDQIRGIGFVDAYGIFLMMVEGAQTGPFRVAGLKSGQNELWLDAVKLTDRQLERAFTVEDGSRDIPRFVAILGPDLEVARAEQGVKDKPAWELRYALDDGQVGFVVWALRPGLVAESMGLHVVLGTLSETTLLLQVEEKDGSKYNHVLQLGAGQEVDEVIAWPNFTLDDQSTDENGRLDPGELKSVLLGDATGIFTGKGRKNVLKIGLIEPVK
ncbi:MAG: CIA30 family protein [Armatimonadetes bacterium]|nr:CIA30 family protein [Armatimonadota bacterium]